MNYQQVSLQFPETGSFYIGSSSRTTEFYPLYARPNKNGFFGLRELQRFTETVIEPYAQAKTDNLFILDFSLVKVWDISAVLWLIIALHHYRQQDFNFLLRLPESQPGMSNDESEEFDRSADFLRRWRFEVGLRNLAPNPDALLIPEQKGYFSKGLKRFYFERNVMIKGVQEALISQRLLGVRNLTDIYSLDQKGISDKVIADCIATFQSARIGDILSIQCGIDKRKADLFADHLLTESLMNAKEHPSATIGIMAISIMGKTGELILAVADNGYSISETIYPVYSKKFKGQKLSYPQTGLPAEEKEKVIDYATQSGVSRKEPKKDEEIGMGLHYIKQDTLDTFNGNLRIITDSIYLTYKGVSSDPSCEREDRPFHWRGNLLRIAIPLSRKDS